MFNGTVTSQPYVAKILKQSFKEDCIISMVKISYAWEMQFHKKRAESLIENNSVHKHFRHASGSHYYM